MGISRSFSANGQTSAEHVIAGDVHVLMTGTFNLTVVVEEWINGGWVVRKTYTGSTAIDETLKGGAEPSRWRARSTAYTSGPASFALR